MKSKAVLLGHPIHPMLIPFPFAFLAGTLVFDAAGWLGSAPSLWITGAYLGLAGIATAILAALPGLVDYLYTVPPKSSARARATKHMLTNLSAVALFAGAWLMRGATDARPELTQLALEAIGLAVLVRRRYVQRLGHPNAIES